MYRKSSMRKRVFPILSDLSGAYFSVTNLFFFCFHTGKLLIIFMLCVMKEYEKKTRFFYLYNLEKKKETLGLLNKRRNNKATEPS